MPAFVPGQYVEKYRVVRLIAEGGMGAVYEVVRDDIGQRAALKLLTLDSHAHPVLHQRFINEARAANQIKHPGVPQVHDFGRLTDGTPWFVMEYLEGETLLGRMEAALRSQRKGLDLEEVLAIGSDLASVLGAAHALGIVHRDLKPANAMLVLDPQAANGERVKVLDFGVAKLHSDSYTQAGVILGTCIYMAPEQFENSAGVDGKADVYSLGIILYQCLSGQFPFLYEPEMSTYALMAAKRFDPPISLTKYMPSLSVDVVTLIMRMLEAKPAGRPAMAEVELEIRRVLGQPPPRQSGYYSTVPRSAAPAAAGPLAITQGEVQDPTLDVPAHQLVAVQGAVPTPSGEKAAGEISPVGLPVPISISSMPSVPVAVPADGLADRPVTPVLPQLIPATLSLSVPMPMPVSTTPPPPSPAPVPPPRRSLRLFFMSAVLLVSATIPAAIALWPRQPPAPVSPAAPAPVSPAAPAPPVPSPKVALTPPEPAADPEPATKVTLPEPTPASERTLATSAKPSGRTCEPKAPTQSCIITPAVTMIQRDILFAAVNKLGTKFCPGEALVVGGLPNAPVITQAPAALRKDSQPILALTLRGMLRGRAFPAKVKIQCKR